MAESASSRETSCRGDSSTSARANGTPFTSETHPNYGSGAQRAGWPRKQIRAISITLMGPNCHACGAPIAATDAFCPNCGAGLSAPTAPTAPTGAAANAAVHLSPDAGIQAYSEPYPRVQPGGTMRRAFIPGREVVHVSATRGDWVELTANGYDVGWVDGRQLVPPAAGTSPRYVPAAPAPMSASTNAQILQVDVLVGALAGIGVLIGALVDWTQGIAVNSFHLPAAFLFDSRTTSRDPRLGWLVIVIGLLGVLISFLPLPGGWRVLLGLLAVLVAVLYCGQVASRLNDLGAHASFTDVVGAGPWVTGIAGIVLAMSPLFKPRF